MATVGLPEMKRFNYADQLSAGSVASGGGLGMIMPPSVVLIVYGILTEQSIGKLFVAGIVPAIVVTALYHYNHDLVRPEPGPGTQGETFSWKERFKSLLDLGETLLVFALVMGGLFFGIFTPTEAAAVGVMPGCCSCHAISTPAHLEKLSWMRCTKLTAHILHGDDADRRGGNVRQIHGRNAHSL
jgi:C4-dicarboxylate transporter, DctM subunit